MTRFLPAPLIDGLDQLDGTVHEAAVRRAVQRLLEEVPRARIVPTSRRDPHLLDATDVPMPSVGDDAARRFLRARGIDPAAHDRLIDIADGRWLVLDLAADHADKPGAVTLQGLYARLVARARSRSGTLVDDVLALLAAAGTGPVLPVDLLQAALRTTRQTSRGQLLEVLGDEDLYRVVDRAGPGTAGDHAGLFHETLTDHLRAGDVVPAHVARRGSRAARPRSQRAYLPASGHDDAGHRRPALRLVRRRWWLGVSRRGQRRSCR